MVYLTGLFGVLIVGISFSLKGRKQHTKIITCNILLVVGIFLLVVSPKLAFDLDDIQYSLEEDYSYNIASYQDGDFYKIKKETNMITGSKKYILVLAENNYGNYSEKSVPYDKDKIEYDFSNNGNPRITIYKRKYNFSRYDRIVSLGGAALGDNGKIERIVLTTPKQTDN